MRIDVELANIRKKFAASANLTSYQKKKYVWKMCYIYMLGYEVDFGHIEMISLLSSTKFQEKSVGYMAVSLLLKPTDELITLVVNSMRNDLIGQVHYGQTLALAAIANIGGGDVGEALAPDIQRLVTDPISLATVSSGSQPYSPEAEFRNRALIRKKSALCLLRLFRTNPDCIEITEWPSKLGVMLEERDLGIVLSLMGLLVGFATSYPSEFESCVPYVVNALHRVVVNRNCPPDYTYYKTPSPWLQIKCLRFLQLYRPPSEQEKRDLLNDALRKILIKSDGSESVNKSNADHAIVIDAINLLILYGSQDSDARLHQQALVLLGKFISVKDANLRYLGLDAMARLAKLVTTIRLYL